jgi:gag-polypeptide of LTR copia-type
VASMELYISEICTYQESAKEIWDYLQETYDQNQNFSHVYNLKQELTQIKQENLTNCEYLTELRRKLEELKLYMPPTTDLKEIYKRAERDEIYLYLSGLDESYENIRSHILLSVDLPPFKTVVVMIQREKARRRGMVDP